MPFRQTALSWRAFGTVAPTAANAAFPPHDTTPQHYRCLARTRSLYPSARTTALPSHHRTTLPAFAARFLRAASRIPCPLRARLPDARTTHLPNYRCCCAHSRYGRLRTGIHLWTRNAGDRCRCGGTNICIRTSRGRRTVRTQRVRQPEHRKGDISGWPHLATAWPCGRHSTPSSLILGTTPPSPPPTRLLRAA